MEEARYAIRRALRTPEGMQYETLVVPYYKVARVVDQLLQAPETKHTIVQIIIKRVEEDIIV